MKLAVDMKASRRTVWGTEKENFSTRMEDIMTENGKITKCMGGESYFTKEENWLMKGTGHMTSSMDMERFITITLSVLIVVSIIQTSIY